ncbi:MAG: hypothetical protein ABIG68_05710 [Acidobacteriota bacterium]
MVQSGHDERAWIWFDEVTAAVMRRVILVLTYRPVVTPLGLLRRLLGPDSLRLQFDRTANTYWVKVEEDGPCSRPDKLY